MQPSDLHFQLNLAVGFIPVQDIRLALFLLGIQGKLEGVFYRQLDGFGQVYPAEQAVHQAHAQQGMFKAAE
jgi:hypothetical protein